VAKTKQSRWKQRFDNFGASLKAFHLLIKEYKTGRRRELLRDGIAYRFQATYELGWKTMRDYLEEGGNPVRTGLSRNVVKEAFKAGVLDDGKVWIDMTDDRNAIAHTYDPDKFQPLFSVIEKRYLKAFDNLHEKLLPETK